MLDPTEYVGRRVDGVWDAALKTSLRAESEEARANFLARVLVLQEQTGKGTAAWFALARHLLEDPRSYEHLLREGLKVADASTIMRWLECCVQKIGMRRVISFLREEDSIPTARVDLTAYWLPRLARSKAEQAVAMKFVADRQVKKGGLPSG